MNSLGGPELIMIALLIGSLVSTVLWIWMLVDCISNEPAEVNDRMIWTIAIAITGVLGALAYLFFRRPQRVRLAAR